ncbi:hypothetical protein CBS101457_004148 [Exobasidium rhododendri]|nr:hypothetical protein CBS101457_004148 [Exobasidium rhododendri]
MTQHKSVEGEGSDREHRHKPHHSSRHDEAQRHRDHRSDRHRRSRSRSPSSSHRRRHEHNRHREETDEERRSRKRYEKGEESRDKHKHKRSHKDASGEASSRVEAGHRGVKNDSVRAVHAAANIPTSESLNLQSHPNTTSGASTAPLPQEPFTVSSLVRDDWMLTDSANPTSGEPAPDYFTDLGTYSRPKAPKEDQDRPNPDQLQVSSKEINSQFAQGKHIDDYEKTVIEANKPGGPGHQWRMMKLRRVYEAAEDEGRDVSEVAVERYGSFEAFNEARIERQYLDDHGRGGGGGGERRRDGGSNRSSLGASRPPSQSTSRQSFRRPGELSTPSTPQALQVAQAKRSSAFKGSSDTTPIPNVFTPTLNRADSKLRESMGKEHSGPHPPTLSQAISASQSDASNSNPPLTAAALNKLSAKVLRAEMMGAVDAADLRARLMNESARAGSGSDNDFKSVASHHVGGEGSGTESHIQVLPTLDARGRLYDVGKSQEEDDQSSLPGNKRKKNQKFESRDAKTGEVLRYNADDDEQSLADLVRQERFGAGSADQKNVDVEMASRITSDQAFKDNIDYMDDNVERLARKKIKSDAMKRQFAIQDFAKTKKALDSCRFCWQEEGARPPRATVISSGTRTYLALPQHEPLTLGHCVIVPMQHYVSTLEADDDDWEEMKNFMKCLMQTAASRKQGVVFYETVTSIKQQRHTVIEAVPIDHDLFQQLPAYFKQSIVTIGDEWSQNKKLIDFSPSRTFRKAMVPQLPYFMVQWDYKGEKGYGHVIEDGDGFDGGAAGGGGDDYGFEMTQSSKGGGDFPTWFAAEIIGNLLELEPRRWRKPRRLQDAEQAAQLTSFQEVWKKFDWTAMIGQ